MAFKAPAQVDERRILEAFRAIEADLRALGAPQTAPALDRRESTTIRPTTGKTVRVASGQQLVLPAARPSEGLPVFAAVEATPEAPITVVADDGSTVNGAASATLTTAGLVIFQSTGASWVGTFASLSAQANGVDQGGINTLNVTNGSQVSAYLSALNGVGTLKVDLSHATTKNETTSGAGTLVTTDWNDYDVIYVTGSGNKTVLNIPQPLDVLGNVTGKRLILICGSGTSSITLTHNSGNPSNIRILCPNLANVVMTQLEVVELFYSTFGERWHTVSHFSVKGRDSSGTILAGRNLFFDSALTPALTWSVATVANELRIRSQISGLPYSALETIAEARLMGRAVGAGTGVAAPLTGDQVASIARWSDDEVQSGASGTVTLTIAASTTNLRIDPAGTLTVTNISQPARAGQLVFVVMTTGGGDNVQWVHDGTNIHTPNGVTVDQRANDIVMLIHSANGEATWYVCPLYVHDNAVYTASIQDLAVTPGKTDFVIRGSADPEGNVTADPATLYLRTTAGSGTTLYVKESGTGNTGWVGK